MRDTDFVAVRCHADSLSGSATAAYWDEARKDFHIRYVLEELAAIADILGLALVPKPATLTAADLPDAEPEAVGEWIDAETLK